MITLETAGSSSGGSGGTDVLTAVRGGDENEEQWNARALAHADRLIAAVMAQTVEPLPKPYARMATHFMDPRLVSLDLPFFDARTVRARMAW